MKITNQTHYQTRDLRKVLTRALKAVGCKGTHLTVTFVYAQRHGYVTGNASLGRLFSGKILEGRRMRLRLPFVEQTLRLEDLCWVAMHEAQHIIGIEHRDMTSAMRSTHKQPLPAWAEGLEVRIKEVRPRKPRQQRLAEVVDLRAKRAQSNLDKWLKTEKHATVMRKKWAKKVKYYENRTAAKQRDTNPNKETM